MTERKPKAASANLDDEQSRSISKSLVRGLAILACFTSEEPLLGISDIADRLDSSRSTTHRYACTLVELGYLEQDSRRRYHLGPRAADIGISVLRSMELRKRSHPHLERLRDSTAHTVSLALLDRTEVLVIERLPAQLSVLEQLDQPIAQGSRLPAHCTATGKLLLALASSTGPPRLPPEMKLTRHGPNSITNKRAFYTELERIRERALADEDEELRTDARSLAVPLRDAHGEVLAAIAISMPSSACQISGLEKKFAEQLLEIAARISAELEGVSAEHDLSEPAAQRRINRHVARKQL